MHTISNMEKHDSDNTLVGEDPAHRNLDDRLLERDDSVNRYVILRKLGEGGMGVVYVAYDPELDRKLALKLLRPDTRGKSIEDGHTRLLREAQALAQLDHPNVVPVHDVGTYEDRVFLAMEFLEGQSLGEWLKEKKRNWKDILDAFDMAGKGLAAAHNKGLVHHDFKPENVMIGDDGRARVMDFGLAQLSGDADESQAGKIVGTPAYMAPEQMTNSQTDARTDQFSFCIALWEALYGARPFKGNTLAAIAYNVLQGDLTAPPKRTNVPNWIRHILEKGLSSEPNKRFENMPSLLEAFKRAQSRSRIKRLLAGVTCVSALMGVIGFAQHRNLRQQEEDIIQKKNACRAKGDSITEVWNPVTRNRVLRGLLSTNKSYAKTTANRILPMLDNEADSWAKIQNKICLASDVEKTWTPDMRANADECLNEKRMDLEFLAEEFSRANLEVTQNGVSLVASLSKAEDCGDERELSLRATLPEKGVEEAREIRVLLSKANSLLSAGRYEEAELATKEAMKQAEVLGHSPLFAETRIMFGTLLLRIGDYEASEKELSSAYSEAGTSGAHEIAARAATLLVYVVGYKKAEYSDGLVWGKAAEVSISEVETEEGLRSATLMNNLANIHHALKDYEKSKVLHQRALDIRKKILDPQHPDVSQSLNNLATIHYATADYEQAKSLYEQALIIRKESLGPNHPDVAVSLNNLAGVYYADKNYEQAKVLYEQALTIKEKIFGPDHQDVAVSLNNLAVVYKNTEDYDLAIAFNKRALAIREKTLGPEHPYVVQSLKNLAKVYRKIGRNEEAQRLDERAAAISGKDD